VDFESLEHHLLWVQEELKDIQGTQAHRYLISGMTRQLEVARGTAKGQTLRGVHTLKTVANRPVWYRFTADAGASILFQKIYNDTFKIGVTSPDETVLCDNTFYEILPREGGDDAHLFLVAALLSSLTVLNIELFGRSNFGGGALDIKVYEVERLPIPDPALLSPSQWHILRECVDALVNRPCSPIDQEIHQEDRRRLDRLFFDALGVSPGLIPVFYSQLVALVRSRIERAHPGRKSR
jgi:hypothetical protein